MVTNIYLIQNFSPEIGDGTIHLGSTHVHANYNMRISVEFQQRAASSSTPFGTPLRSYQTLFHQTIDNPQYSWQTYFQPLRDRSAGNWAFPPDDLEDCGSIYFAHGG